MPLKLSPLQVQYLDFAGQATAPFFCAPSMADARKIITRQRYWTSPDSLILPAVAAMCSLVLLHKTWVRSSQPRNDYFQILRIYDGPVKANFAFPTLFDEAMKETVAEIVVNN